MYNKWCVHGHWKIKHPLNAAMIGHSKAHLRVFSKQHDINRPPDDFTWPCSQTNRILHLVKTTFTILLYIEKNSLATKSFLIDAQIDMRHHLHVILFNSNVIWWFIGACDSSLFARNSNSVEFTKSWARRFVAGCNKYMNTPCAKYCTIIHDNVFTHSHDKNPFGSLQIYVFTCISHNLKYKPELNMLLHIWICARKCTQNKFNEFIIISWAIAFASMHRFRRKLNVKKWQSIKCTFYFCSDSWPTVDTFICIQYGKKYASKGTYWNVC